jgi:hypothetical protein
VSDTNQPAKLTGKISVNPNPVPFDKWTAVISWETNDPAGGEVRVSISPGEEKVVSRGPSGQTEIPWIVDSTIYDFRLYAASQPDTPIDSVKVRRDLDSVPTVLRELADEVMRGNIDVALPSFIAGVVPRFLHSGKFREVFTMWERHGFHVTPVHFYQPIPDTQSLPEKVWNQPSKLVGIDMNDSVQLDLLRTHFPKFRDEYEQFPAKATGKPDQFYLENGLFECIDALVAYCVVRHFQPGLIVEVGGGFSSLLLGQALAKNNNNSNLICIEPFPQDFLRKGFAGLRYLIEKPVQGINLEFFSQLHSEDILFVDSSHTVKTGGDVNYLFLEVLPRLNPGVIVHVHDIFLPFEYRRDWIMDELRFWTEQYLLQAFLTFNSEFEVLLANSYLSHRYREDLKATFPSLPFWGGGSFWMRRRNLRTD